MPAVKKLFLTILYLLPFVLFQQLSAQTKFVNTESAYKNFYGISWRGKPHDNLVFARQMQYDYVFYQPGMEQDTLSNGLYFYLETPEYSIYNRRINTRRVYPDEDIAFFNNYCVLKDTVSRFPYNLATGWQFDNDTFTPLLDFQQQKVIDWAIEQIFKLVERIQERNPKFRFGGFAWDEPRLSGDFWQNFPKRKAATLLAWRSTESGALKPGALHHFKTYTEGHIAFYNQLVTRARKKYGILKILHEPFNIYDEVKELKNKHGQKLILPDIFCQEGSTSAFVTDARIFANGRIKKGNVYCTSPNVFAEELNRQLAAIAAINGAGFGWYGRFGGTGSMPDYQSITEVPARLKLIRCLTFWENKNNVPLSKRKWLNGIYSSPCAYVTPDVIALVQPGTKKLFIVFLTMQGRYPISQGKTIGAIAGTDDSFMEENSTKIPAIENGIISSGSIDNLNKAYIISFN